MIKRYAAAALLLAVIPTCAAATATPKTAAAATTTLHLKLHVTGGLELDKKHFVGTERVQSRDTHEFVGFDTFRGQVKPNTVVYETAFAFKGGILLTRVHDEGQAGYAGHVIGGTGAFVGATGTVSGRSLTPEDTLFTITYTR
jgi:hypothetical protein